MTLENGTYTLGPGDGTLSVRTRRTAWLASRLKSLSPEELAAVDAALAPLARLVDEE